MKRILIALLSTIVITPSFAAFDFIGTYKCRGYDPYLEKNYTGIVKIEQQNTVYKLTMKYDTGEDAVGTAGLFDPDTISVVFQDKNNPKLIGLERYAVGKDGKSIEGYWVYLNEDKLGTEQCDKL